MRWLAAMALMLSTASVWADRIILIPLDTRPAAGQFAQMIANIGSEDLRMPPYKLLGRFTTPGDPEGILAWLRTQDFRRFNTLIVSADMLCYGGLIASRDDATPRAVALARLQALVDIHRSHPNVKLYVFSSTMRLIPTATRRASGWRLRLARLEELLDRIRRLGETNLHPEADAVRAQVPAMAVKDYEHARARDLDVQRQLVHLAQSRDIDYLIISEDDAKPYGPQIADTIELRGEVSRLGVAGHVFFCEGVDQDASVLVSRALLKAAGWTPRVRVVYSDPEGSRKYASYETEPIENCLRDQLYASGARPVLRGADYDYTLFVNTPNRPHDSFFVWLKDLQEELDLGLPVAVADVNLADDGTADEELIAGLRDPARLTELLAFAGWNTAGNSLGTAIPEANVYLLAKKLNSDPLRREIAQREFLLNRFVDDYAYHKYTRPVAYGMILSSNHDEVYGEPFYELDDFVSRDMAKEIDRIFAERFKGQKFRIGDTEYEVTGLDHLKVMLPWPRAYEVRLQFRLSASPLN